MAWPKKDTRKIHLKDTVYLWHLSGNYLNSDSSSITIGKNNEKYFLFLDPYVWDTVIEPNTIREVIEWALSNSWTAENGPTRAVAYSRKENKYVWLPDGVRHIYLLES